MANFPPSPSLGELFTINNMTYRFNESGAWEVVITQSDESLVDVGVSTFVNESSSPSAVAGKALLYAKDVVGTPVAEILYHFDGDTDDSSGNGNDGANTGVSFVASGVTGFTSGKAGVFDGSSATVGGDDYVVFDDPGILAGDFTLEFWWRRTLSSGSDSPVSINTGSQNAAGGFGIYCYSTTTCKIFYWDAGASTAATDTFTLPSHSANTWHHFRLVRSSTSHILYWDGAKVGSTATHTAHSIGTSSLEWNIGRLHDGTHNTWPDLANYNLKGQMDEFRITKTAVFTGTSFTPPIAPYSGPSTTSKLHVMDSTGSEGVIT